MKAAVYYTNSDVRVEEVPKPEAGAGELIMKTDTCGICVADTMEWYNKPKAPVVLGHQAVGYVDEVGEGVEDFKVGDRIFVHHHIACMSCEQCRKGHYTLCKQFKKTNYKPGGFAQYLKASSEHVKKDTIKIPDNVSFEEASLIEPLACALHGIERLDVKPSDKIAVIGTGTIGLMLIESLKAYGVSDIVAYEMIPWRQKVAKEKGALDVRVADDDIEKELEILEEEFGWNQFDKVCVMAKDVRAMETGFKLTGKGGKLLLFATPEEYLIALNELDKGIAQTIGRGECLKCIVKTQEINKDKE